MQGAKLAVAVLWILSAACFFVGGDSQAASIGRTLFWCLAVAHAVECVVFLPKLRQAGGPLSQHLLQTFLFGIAHVRGLPAEPAHDTSAP